MNTDPANQPEPETGFQPDDPLPEPQDENSITYPRSAMELEPHVSLFAGAITCILSKTFTHALGAQEARELATEVWEQLNNAEQQLSRDEDYCPYDSLGVALHIALDERYPQYLGSLDVREKMRLFTALINWLEGAALRYSHSTFAGWKFTRRHYRAWRTLATLERCA